MFVFLTAEGRYYELHQWQWKSESTQQIRHAAHQDII